LLSKLERVRDAPVEGGERERPLSKGEREERERPLPLSEPER